MRDHELVIVEEFCNSYDVDISFVQSLHQSGLVELVVIEEKDFIPEEQLADLEKLVHFREMGINIAGMETILHLLDKLEEMQKEIKDLHNKLSLFS